MFQDQLCTSNFITHRSYEYEPEVGLQESMTRWRILPCETRRMYMGSGVLVQATAVLTQGSATVQRILNKRSQKI